jgi:hypothetical protein
MGLVIPHINQKIVMSRFGFKPLCTQFNLCHYSTAPAFTATMKRTAARRDWEGMNRIETRVRWGSFFYKLNSGVESTSPAHVMTLISLLWRLYSEVKMRYEANAGFVFKTSKTSFHSSPKGCFSECCKETRYAIMVNWQLEKMSRDKKAEDAITNREDSKRYKWMLRSQGHPRDHG